MFAETHFAQRNMQLREIIKRMRHDGCGGRAGKVELMTGIEGSHQSAGAEDRAVGVGGPAPPGDFGGAR